MSLSTSTNRNSGIRESSIPCLLSILDSEESQRLHASDMASAVDQVRRKVHNPNRLGRNKLEQQAAIRSVIDLSIGRSLVRYRDGELYLTRKGHKVLVGHRRQRRQQRNAA